MPLLQKPFSLGHLIFSAYTKKRQAPDQFKPFSIRINNKYSNQRHLERFTNIFLPPEQLPSYSFIASFSSVMQCLAQAPIPSGLLGLIHISTSFRQVKAHNWHLPYDMEITIKSLETSPKGLTYETTTEFYQMGELTLVNNNCFLDKNKSYRPEKSNQNKDQMELPQAIGHDHVTSSTALKYAAASGDFNPIHLGTLPAKLFGQKRALIHGMYSVHWALKQIFTSEQSTEFENIEVNFNKPCFIPAHISLYPIADGEYGIFDNGNASIRHLLIKTKKGA